jgi:K+-sensing histidine kinase KdpD
LVEPEVLFFSTYYPAVLVATLYAGRGPGILALLLSLSAAWLLFLPPYLHLAVPSRKTLLNLLLFTLSAGLLVWVADRYRAALEALRKSEERRSLLVDELQHRSKNTLAVAGALVSSTLARCNE